MPTESIKETGHEFSTLHTQHAPTHSRPPHSTRWPENIADTATGTGPGFEGTENDGIHPGIHQRSSAHRARFQGHDECAARETPTITVNAGGTPDRQYLRVGRGVTVHLAPVRRRRKLSACRIDNERPNRNVILRCRAGNPDGPAHERLRPDQPLRFRQHRHD